MGCLNKSKGKKKDLQEISEQPDTSMKKMLVVGVYMVNTTKDHTKQVLNTTGMKMLMSVVLDQPNLDLDTLGMKMLMMMLVVDVYTANTTKDHTKQVLNTTGMRQKKMLVLPLIGQFLNGWSK